MKSHIGQVFDMIPISVTWAILHLLQLVLDEISQGPYIILIHSINNHYHYHHQRIKSQLNAVAYMNPSLHSPRFKAISSVKAIHSIKTVMLNNELLYISQTTQLIE